MVDLPRAMPALITPFDRSGELDVEAHQHNVRHLGAIGVEGFVLGGSNGQGPYLEPGERRALVESIRGRKAHLMCGIAAESSRQAAAQLGEAQEAGADTALVMTPTTLVRGRAASLIRFYRDLAEHASIPVLLYSVPAVTGYSLDLSVITELSRHENVVGMKDSSGDVVRLQTIIDSTPGGFVLFTGSSRSVAAAAAVGCHGAITGSGNYAPVLVRQIVEAAGDDPGEARRLQRKLSRISADIEAHGVPGVLAAARAAGLEPGYPREPLTRVTKGVETALAKLV